MREFSQELEQLEQKKRELEEQIHTASTLAESQKLSSLENEVNNDRQRAKDLEALACATAIKNKPLIKHHLDEAERLRLESFDINADSWEIHHRLREKQREVFRLRDAIKRT